MSKETLDKMTGIDLLHGLVTDVMDLKVRVAKLENKPQRKKKEPLIKGPIDQLKSTAGASELLKEVGHEPQEIWVETYGLELIKRELPKIYAWCKSNPAKGRKKDWPRFINNWLSKSFEKETPAILTKKLKPADPEFY